MSTAITTNIPAGNTNYVSCMNTRLYEQWKARKGCKLGLYDGRALQPLLKHMLMCCVVPKKPSTMINSLGIYWWYASSNITSCFIYSFIAQIVRLVAVMQHFPFTVEHTHTHTEREWERGDILPRLFHANIPHSNRSFHFSLSGRLFFRCCSKIIWVSDLT